jgi:sulfide:quinone oxidoreductase
MDTIVYITPNFAVTSALAPQDFAAAAELGFRSILSNRPDGEEAGQMTGREEAVHAWRAGLKFAQVPAPKLDIFTDAVVESMEEAIGRLDGPILAHCKSGLRSAIAWAAASARSQPVDCVLAALTAAGFELNFLRDDLEAQSDRKRWIGAPAPALDCSEAETAKALEEAA